MRNPFKKSEAHIVQPESIPENFPANDCPSVLIKFENPQFPTFEFLNWKPGISLGTFERAGNMLVREAQKAQARLLTQMKTTDEFSEE
jgi:hypothetical protein